MQKFWINRTYVSDKEMLETDLQFFEINIPNNCQECNRELVVVGGSNCNASIFKSTCGHFITYYNVWNSRIENKLFEKVIIDTINDGCKCTKCGLWSAMSAPNQPDNTFKCFLCRTRGF